MHCAQRAGCKGLFRSPSQRSVPRIAFSAPSCRRSSTAASRRDFIASTVAGHGLAPKPSSSTFTLRSKSQLHTHTAGIVALQKGSLAEEAQTQTQQPASSEGPILQPQQEQQQQQQQPPEASTSQPVSPQQPAVAPEQQQQAEGSTAAPEPGVTNGSLTTPSQSPSAQSLPPAEAAPPPSTSSPAPKDALQLSEEAAKKLLDEEEERRKLRKRKKGRIRELEEVSAEGMGPSSTSRSVPAFWTGSSIGRQLRSKN